MIIKSDDQMIKSQDRSQESNLNHTLTLTLTLMKMIIKSYDQILIKSHSHSDSQSQNILILSFLSRCVNMCAFSSLSRCLDMWSFSSLSHNLDMHVLSCVVVVAIVAMLWCYCNDLTMKASSSFIGFHDSQTAEKSLQNCQKQLFSKNVCFCHLWCACAFPIFSM